MLDILHGMQLAVSRMLSEPHQYSISAPKACVVSRAKPNDCPKQEARLGKVTNTIAFIHGLSRAVAAREYVVEAAYMYIPASIQARSEQLHNSRTLELTCVALIKFKPAPSRRGKLPLLGCVTVSGTVRICSPFGLSGHVGCQG